MKNEAGELVMVAKELMAAHSVMFDFGREGGDLFCFIPQPDGVEMLQYIDELGEIDKFLKSECKRVIDYLKQEFNIGAGNSSTEISFKGNPRLSIYIDFMTELDTEDMRRLRSDLNRIIH